jgi:hypothetical protein
MVGFREVLCHVVMFLTTYDSRARTYAGKVRAYASEYEYEYEYDNETAVK